MEKKLGKLGKIEEKIVTSEIFTVIKKRPKISHKGTFGRVLLVGGSFQYGGAIMMATTACLYSGAGLITVATDPRNRTAILTRTPEVMTIDWNDQDLVQQNLAQADLILVGSGLGEADQQLNLLKLILATVTNRQYLVIDGSAINLIAQNQLEFPRTEKIIFTPHQKEWERLSGCSIDQQNPQTNFALAQKLEVTCILKSAQTQIVFPQDVTIYFLNNGTPAMATGGMGDTLAGMIAGIVVQFKSNEAVLLATFLHSQIAHDLAATNYVVLPTQISQLIPSYLHRYSS